MSVYKVLKSLGYGTLKENKPRSTVKIKNGAVLKGIYLSTNSSSSTKIDELKLKFLEAGFTELEPLIYLYGNYKIRFTVRYHLSQQSTIHFLVPVMEKV